MEDKVSEILENVLGLLALEGSFEVVEKEEEVEVSIEATDPGRLIGFRGETLDALQLIVNQILSKQVGDDFKRVIIDVKGWRKNKEEDLTRRAKQWAQQVLDSGKEMELEPMPAWQRRVVHMAVSEIEGIASESIGEGYSRHLVLKVAGKEEGKKEKIEEKEEPVEASPSAE